jgi:hypothetical protein
MIPDHPSGKYPPVLLIELSQKGFISSPDLLQQSFGGCISCCFMHWFLLQNICYHEDRKIFNASMIL